MGIRARLSGAIVLGVALAGCSMPMPVTIASYAMDGFSYLATGKSMTDHGISIVLQRDCALLRGLMEGQLCYDDGISNSAVALAAPDDGTVDLPDPAALAAFQTAAGGNVDGPFTQMVVLPGPWTASAMRPRARFGSSSQTAMAARHMETEAKSRTDIDASVAQVVVLPGLWNGSTVRIDAAR
ncbi:MAG: hypothetical protein H7840_06335 [Alphaproteobacteria bacterium]